MISLTNSETDGLQLLVALLEEEMTCPQLVSSLVLCRMRGSIGEQGVSSMSRTPGLIRE
ncbi:unnamed protein product, partial [Ilex paraguariensis]